MNALSIKIKTLVLFIVAICFVAGTSLIVIAYQTKKLGDVQITDERTLILKMNQEELKAYTLMAEKAISAFYELTLDQNIAQKVKEDALVFKKMIEDIYATNKDKLSAEELRTLIYSVTNGYRYNNDIGYFYAYTPEGVNVVHPINKALVGKNLIELKDKNGAFIVKDVIQSAKDGTGVSKFIFPNPKTKLNEPKVAYNFYFEPLDVVFGTGDYASSIKEYYQNEAIKVLEKLRYAEDGYFYAIKINEKNYEYAFHAINPTWKGKEIKIDAKDSQGRPYRKEIIEGATKNASDGAFVTYTFAHPVTKKDADKLTYAKYFKEWDWIIVSGVYIDGVEKHIEEQAQKINTNTRTMLLETIVYGAMVALIAVIIIYFLINRMIIAPLLDLKSKAYNLAQGDGDLTKQIETKNDDEIGGASKEINSFIDKVRSTIVLAKTTSSENASIAHELSSTTLQVGKRVEVQRTLSTKQPRCRTLLSTKSQTLLKRQKTPKMRSLEPTMSLKVPVTSSKLWVRKSKPVLQRKLNLPIKFNN